MKRSILLFFFALIAFSYTASAQRYSLYYTKTLYDGIANPHHKSLDSCRSWASNFFIFPSMGLDFRLTGDINDFVKAALASENLSSMMLENGEGHDNIISNRFNYNLFMLKVRMGRKRDAEFSIYSQIKAETAISINNGFFSFITRGNTPYLGSSIDGFMNFGGVVNAYNETGIGFRRQIYKNLSGGFKVGYLTGAANATFDIQDSKLETSAQGDTITVTIKGSVKSSVDPNNTDNLVENILKNRGIVFSGGLQYQLTKRATLGAALLDFGSIKWNENSRVMRLDETKEFIGMDAFASKFQRDSMMKTLTEFAVDSTYESYTSPLLSRIEFSANYRWANWFNQTVIVSKPLLTPDIDLIMLHNLVAFKRVNFIFLTGYNTDGFASVGAQFAVRTRMLDFYVGSEKVLNTYQISQQVSDHTKKPTLGLGADINFGIALGFGRCPKPLEFTYVPTDSDGDGILDVADECPFKAGPRENNGCPWPDTDGDGVMDNVDECVNIPGPVENNGCPWPDSDNDSIPDKDDLCPTIAGPLSTNGCPDSDGDGVADKDDACPNEAGPAENLGCPWVDTDGDGVPDKFDQCPDVPGVLTNNGCPVEPKKVELSAEEQEVINKVFTNLNFQSGKAIIAPSSFDALNTLYELLIKKPTFMVLIEGHTDNVGKAASNKKLSQDRADAVKKYLENKGIEAERLIAMGYGSERPIADNNTTEGKAKNRRVEFTILEK